MPLEEDCYQSIVRPSETQVGVLCLNSDVRDMGNPDLSVELESKRAEFIAISAGEYRSQPRHDVGFSDTIFEGWELEQRIDNEKISYYHCRSLAVSLLLCPLLMLQPLQLSY
jgi:hypothetical protein